LVPAQPGRKKARFIEVQSMRLCVLNENLSTSCLLLLLLLHHYVLSGGCESIEKGLALYKEQREAGFNQNCERMCGTNKKKKENQPLALKCRLA